MRHSTNKTSSVAIPSHKYVAQTTATNVVDRNNDRIENCIGEPCYELNLTGLQIGMSSHKATPNQKLTEARVYTAGTSILDIGI